YEDLERDGFIETATGRGSFVASKNLEFVREEHLRMIEDTLQQTVTLAKTASVSRDELIEILNLLYENE
nr:GntR family transcriptional regulator [Clostridia bacterium]